MTSHRIGVNLRVSGNCDQGGRKYMEDYHAIKFIKKDDRDYEFAYFGIFDGHGGPEASRFARDNLLNEITKYEQFWTDNDEDIMFAIRSGFLDTHQLMWKELDKWPRTVSGLPSTSGTTASIAIIKKSKLYIGHVGDSGIVLGCDEGPCNAIFMKPKCLTKDHKPDNPEEKERIEKSGGSVVAKAGVQRVVWSRPKVNHKGPVRRSTQIDKIPFLAVARSLGDLWSYDYYKGQFVVSPDPDVSVMPIEPGRHRCLILGSDGLWNMLSPAEAVSVVTDLEMHFEDRVIHDPMVSVSYWINPAEKLVTRALNKWRAKMMKADNISCVVVLVDPLGPSKLTILRKRRDEHFQKLKEAKAASAAGHVDDSSTSTSSLSSIDPSTSVGLKANHNQNNLGSRENQDEEGGGGQEAAEERTCVTDTENKAENNRGVDSTEADYRNDDGGGSDGGGFTGRDISSTNLVHGHDLRSSHSPPGLSRTVTKAASAAKPGRPHRGPHKIDSAHCPLSPRRLSHPTLTSKPGEMDDSVQASSALSISPPFMAALSPTSEDPVFPGDSATGEEGSPPYLTSHMSMSDSLLKLMKLDAVKASSDPVPRSNSVSSSVLNSSHMDNPIGRLSLMRDQRKQRRSVQGMLHASRRQHHSMLLTPSVDVNQSLPPTSHALQGTRSLDNTFHVEPGRDKLLQSTRILRVATSQRSSSSGSKSDKTSTDRKAPPLRQGQSTDGSKPLPKSSLIHSTAGGSAKKVKKRRELGLLHRTRTTLLRARRAARRALCPENRPFLKQLPGSKRKREEKRPALGTPSAKRLKRSEGLRYSV